MAEKTVSGSPKLGPGTFVIAGFVTAGLAAFALFAATGGYQRLTKQASTVLDNDTIPSSQNLADTSNVDEAPRDLLANPIEQSKEEQQSLTPPVAPEIELLRVEPDGSTLVAGTAEPGSKVELNSGGKKLGEASVGSSGQYAIVLDTPLEPGDHALGLSSTKAGSSENLLSSTVGIVKVPEDADTGTPNVLISRADQPLEIVQSDNIPAIPGKASSQQSSQTVASTSDSESVSIASSDLKDPDAKIDQDQGEPTSETAALSGQPQTDVKTSSNVSVLLEAADIEANEIYIAGKGRPGTMVDLYLDGVPLGSVRVQQNGSFLFEGRRELELGRYSLRADMVDPKSGKVEARAQVDLLYQPPPPSSKTVKAVKSFEQASGANRLVPESGASPAQNENSVNKPGVTTVSRSNSSSQPAKQSSASDGSNGVEDGDTPLSSDIDKNSQTIKSSQQQDDVRTLVTGTAVIIRSGDSLWRVARRNYGRGIRYTTIFNANRDQIRNPNRIYPGQVLRVPEPEDNG